MELKNIIIYLNLEKSNFMKKIESYIFYSERLYFYILKSFLFD